LLDQGLYGIQLGFQGGLLGTQQLLFQTGDILFLVDHGQFLIEALNAGFQGTQLDIEPLLLFFTERLAVLVGALIQPGADGIHTLHGFADHILGLLGQGLGPGQFTVYFRQPTLVFFQCIQPAGQFFHQGLQGQVLVLCGPVLVLLLASLGQFGVQSGPLCGSLASEGFQILDSLLIAVHFPAQFQGALEKFLVGVGTVRTVFGAFGDLLFQIADAGQGKTPDLSLGKGRQ